jgi:AMMECR1 domain-containing protein
VKPSVFAVLALFVFAPFAASRPAPELDPYREFVHTPRALELLALARAAMRGHWGEGGAGHDPREADWPRAPAGIYLSLTDASGTRACVGRDLPYHGTLPDAVRDLAVQALQADPRRPPVRRDELDHLRIVIAFAGIGEPVGDPMEIDPGRDGLRISSEGKSIAFLPGEARTVAWALKEARRAGVLEGPLESATYLRFPVVALAEPPAMIPPTTSEDSDESR